MCSVYGQLTVKTFHSSRRLYRCTYQETINLPHDTYRYQTREKASLFASAVTEGDTSAPTGQPFRVSRTLTQQSNRHHASTNPPLLQVGAGSRSDVTLVRPSKSTTGLPSPPSFADNFVPDRIRSACRVLLGNRRTGLTRALFRCRAVAPSTPPFREK